MATGMIWLSTPRYTVGLDIVDGVVVDAPPIARRWTIGRDARTVWREAARRGARLVWLPAATGPNCLVAGAGVEPAQQSGL